MNHDTYTVEKREETALSILLKMMELQSVGIHPLTFNTLLTIPRDAVALADKLHDELKK